MTMPRPQLTLRSLLLAILVVAAWFGGVRFGREWQLEEDRAAIEDSEATEYGFFRAAEDARAEIEAQKVEIIRLMNKLDKLTRKVVIPFAL